MEAVCFTRAVSPKSKRMPGVAVCTLSKSCSILIAGWVNIPE